jgi:hypothetical protein
MKVKCINCENWNGDDCNIRIYVPKPEVERQCDDFDPKEGK